MTSFALVEKNVMKIHACAHVCIWLNMHNNTNLFNRFTFGPGNPCPVSPIGPGGPVGPTSPWREDNKDTARNSGNNLSNPSSSSSALYLLVYFKRQLIVFYLLTFGPVMDRPGCPGRPTWPGIPRSPWKGVWIGNLWSSLLWNKSAEDLCLC